MCAGNLVGVHDYICAFAYLSSGAAEHSSVRSVDRWVMSLLWVGDLQSRNSAPWNQRYTSPRSSLRGEVFLGGRSPPLHDREWGWISVACLKTVDKITAHIATGAGETAYCFLLLINGLIKEFQSLNFCILNWICPVTSVTYSTAFFCPSLVRTIK